MEINGKDIEFIKDLSEFEMNGVWHDLHNDFKCFQIEFENHCLILSFKRRIEEYIIEFKFINAILNRFSFKDFQESQDLETIDMIYRGRKEENDSLLELNKSGQAYFYISFYTGIEMELWSGGIVIERVE